MSSPLVETIIVYDVSHLPAERLQASNRCVAVSAYVSAAEDNKIVIPYVPSHLHHMMFELMKVSIVQGPHSQISS